MEYHSAEYYHNRLNKSINYDIVLKESRERALLQMVYKEIDKSNTNEVNFKLPGDYLDLQYFHDSCSDMLRSILDNICKQLRGNGFVVNQENGLLKINF
jgi:hypothetical protein